MDGKYVSMARKQNNKLKCVVGDGLTNIKSA